MIKLFRDLLPSDINGSTKAMTQEQKEMGFEAERYSINAQIAAQQAEIKKLREALGAATEVIKQWHNADEVWDIYFNHAPEMKPIREALKEGGNPPPVNDNR